MRGATKLLCALGASLLIFKCGAATLPTVTLSSSVSITENGTAAVTVSRNSTNGILKVDLSVGGTATPVSGFDQNAFICGDYLLRGDIQGLNELAGGGDCHGYWTTSFKVAPFYVEFQIGESSKTVLVEPQSDTIFESDETVTFAIISNPSVYTVGSPGSSTVTITDVPPTGGGFARHQGTVQPDEIPIIVEGSVNYFDVVRNCGSDMSQPQEVYLQLKGTAIPGNESSDGFGSIFEGFDFDYTIWLGATQLPVYSSVLPPNFGLSCQPIRSISVTIPANSAAMTLTIKAKADGLTEGFETIIIDGGCNTPGPGARFYIQDGLPIVSIRSIDSMATEGPGGTADSGLVRVLRGGATSSALSVSVAISSGYGIDFGLQVVGSGSVTVSGNTATVVIPAGSSSVDLSVNPIDDSLLEGTELVFMNILPGTGYIIDPSVPEEFRYAEVLIIDDEDVNHYSFVSLGVSDRHATEGGDSATFVIQRTGYLNCELQVQFRYGHLGGASVADVTPTGLNNSGSFIVIIPSGVSSVPFPVSAVLDNVVEEPVEVLVGEIEGVTCQTCPCNVVIPYDYILIHDSDFVQTLKPVVDIYASDPVASEGTGDAGKFTIVRTGNNASALNVNLARSGSAQSGDFNSMPNSISTVTIPAGADWLEIDINPIEDTQIECTETVKLSLVPSGSYNIGVQREAIVNIYDNDATSQITLAALPHQPATAFKFTVSGAACGQCNVEASVDTVTWTSIGSFDAVGSAPTVEDLTSVQLARRNYRVRCGQAKSANGVGYYDLTLPPGFSLIANQLFRVPNTFDSLLPQVPDETQIQRYSSGQYTIFYYGPFESGGSGWQTQEGAPAGSEALLPGDGVFFFNPLQGNLTLSFYGQFATSPVATLVAPNFSVKSSAYPKSGSLEQLLGSFPIFEDQALRFLNNNYVTAIFDGAAWLDSTTGDPFTGTLNVGESFFYFNSGSSSRTWTQSYSVFPP